MRTAYLNNGADHMEDHQLLELYLSLVIPRHDVKELSYRLMNTFGSLEGVYNASPQDLQQVDGVGENTAVLLSLFRTICGRVEYNKTKNIQFLDSADAAMDYCQKLLSGFSDERIAVITLTSKLKVINAHIMATGGVSFAGVAPKDIMSTLIMDNPSQVLIAHNHPCGEPSLSGADINFTVNVLGIVRPMSIALIDHIVVGDGECLSMRSLEEYKNYFD